MTNERPLAAVSDEIDRALEAIGERFDRLDGRIDELTTQVKATNGRVKDLEMWRRYWEGVRAGAGGSWGVFLAIAGAAVGVGGVVIALVK